MRGERGDPVCDQITHEQLFTNIYNSASHFLCSSSLLFGLFQATNKGETGVMGFPGPRVSTHSFLHIFQQEIVRVFRSCDADVLGAF